MHRGKEAVGLMQLRPNEDTVFISRNRTILSVGLDGFVHGDSRHGLFIEQTRMLSKWFWRIDDAPAQLVVMSPIEQYSWLGYYIRVESGASGRNLELAQGAPEAAEQTVELRLSRALADGMHEDVDVTNFSRESVQVRLSLECEADFMDQQAPDQYPLPGSELQRHWSRLDEQVWELRWDFTAEHQYDHQGDRGTMRLERSSILRIHGSDADVGFDADSGRVQFLLQLAPKESRHIRMHLAPAVEDKPSPQVPSRYAFKSEDEYIRRQRAFLGDSTTFDASGRDGLAFTVAGALEQARRDLAALRMHDYDRDNEGWVPAAGLPIYQALFGRDILTAGWQAALLGPEMMRGALEELADWQGTRRDDWRDEQPGRHLHESYNGPRAALLYNPLGRYYGSITASAFYPVVVSEYWHWTGDRQTTERLLDSAMKGLQWLDTCARHEDGFYYYKTCSEQGVKHQAWRDSRDAVVDAEGRQVEPPIAESEEQGYVYGAKQLLAEVLWRLGRKAEAKRFVHDAMELKARFNEVFWMEDEDSYALGLNADGEQIRSITSSPAHCLAAGIVEPERAERTARRLFGEDLYSGWGVRTLSARNPAYDPYSYHRGTVWPAEQGTFAMAFYRYGLIEMMHRITRNLFETAELFAHLRLPECISGHPRDELHPIPAMYPKANWPQAWSSSAVVCAMQALLGIYPYAPLKMLAVDPHLPEWLDEITLRRLRVGKARVSIRFYREDDGRSDYEVVDKEGTVHIVRQPSPWSLTAGIGERLHDLLESLLPGK